MIINCSGFQAFHLTGDKQLVPVRGQVVLLPVKEISYSRSFSSDTCQGDCKNEKSRATKAYMARM